MEERPETSANEVNGVRERYGRRSLEMDQARYSLLNEAALWAHQERQRALVRWVHRCSIEPIAEKRVLEVGCGSGGNLLDLIRLGFRPENLTGNELLAARQRQARERLPAAVTLLGGDATRLLISERSFDVVLQFGVFSSLLNDSFQETLARRMWSWVRPGGGVLWYDCIYDNPSNEDVRGVPIWRVNALFPAREMIYWRVTLAPPLARNIARFGAMSYNLFNIRWLRTHVLCWIRKE